MILVNEDTRVLVQGITGREASFHTRKCLEYGTKVVAGVTPGKGSISWEKEVPVFNSVAEAKKETGANASLIFVPAPFAVDAILESADAGIKVVACITEFIPALDELKCHYYLSNQETRLIGPNCPGIISPPGKCKMGIMPSYIHRPGNVGVVSRSGTLTYEAVTQLTEQSLGQTTCVGLGGDPLPGTSFVDILKLFQADPETKAVVLIGEIGGTYEQEAADFIQKHMTKPVVAYIAGSSAPSGKRMGHAGAIISGNASKALNKITSLAAAGATVVENFGQIGLVTKKILSSRI
ncbi:MAG: succinate--CoA ligase subunit alpha [Dehalococcoidales bacterium]|jgi:succinyl-CoA synthetase alpha subunit|nr:succinate--CoA ligase subunit alpha [Dehalococcoidales bacterium]MDP6576265.1 succinate--CoA ligase subunit alpha [Dehalococcoidales bacterium]|tara:strand:- start:884 stop:1765 length:882 start_codon:yes stop_codon:yes gene_type:complete